MSELDELELYKRLMFNIREAENCAKGLAQHRSDARWLGMAQMMEVIFQNVGTLALGRSISAQAGSKLLDDRIKLSGDKASQKRYQERIESAGSDFKQGN